MKNIKYHSPETVVRRQKIAWFLAYAITVTVCSFASLFWGAAALAFAGTNRKVGGLFFVSGIALFFSVKWCAIIFAVGLCVYLPLLAWSGAWLASLVAAPVLWGLHDLSSLSTFFLVYAPVAITLLMVFKRPADSGSSDSFFAGIEDYNGRVFAYQPDSPIIGKEFLYMD